MTLRVFDGFDDYAGISSTDFASIYPTWRLSRESVSYGFASIVSGGTGYGNRVDIASAYQYYTRLYRRLDPTVTEFSFGALVMPDNTYRRSEQMLKAIDEGTGEYVQIDRDTSGGTEIYSSLSGERFVDPESQLENQDAYYELVVTGGSAQLWINNTLRGSVSVGGALDFSYFSFGGGATESNYSNQHIYFDDVYISDFLGTENVGRLGPVASIPLIPVADGAVGNDMAPTPNTGPNYDKVDDYAGGNISDGDATFVAGYGSGVTQTFRCDSEVAFGTALGYRLSATCKTGQATIDVATLVTSSGGSEEVTEHLPLPIGAWKILSTPVYEALPDAAPLTQANLEAAEFGIRLETP